MISEMEALASYGFGIAALGCYAGLVLLALRWFRGVAPVLILAGAALLVHLGAIGIAIVDALPVAYWHGAAIYWLGVVGIVFAFGAVYKSISLRILCALVARPGRALTIDELTAEIVRPSFVGRIAILSDGGLIRAEGGRHTVTPAGRALAQRIRRVQRWAGISESGLYSS